MNNVKQPSSYNHNHLAAPCTLTVAGIGFRHMKNKKHFFSLSSHLAAWLVQSILLILGNTASAQIESSHSTQPEGILGMHYKFGDFGVGFQDLPIAVFFLSKDTYSSVLPGGWNIPFADSHVVRLSDTQVRVNHPDGTEVGLTLENGNLSGGGWSGSLDGDRITIESKLLGQTLMFQKGRIRKFFNNQHQLIWNYDSSLNLRTIEKDGAVFFRVLKEDSGVESTLKLIGENSFEIKMIREVPGVQHYLKGAVVSMSNRNSRLDFDYSDSTEAEVVMEVIPKGDVKTTGKRFSWSNPGGQVKRIDNTFYGVKFPHRLAEYPSVIATFPR